MKKGFTLLELMAVIVVLAMLMLIVYPPIESALKKSRNGSYETQKDSIINATKNWVADHPAELPDEDESITVKLGTLQELGYVDEEIKNPTDNKILSEDCLVKITNVGNQYKYEFLEPGTDGGIANKVSIKAMVAGLSTAGAEIKIYKNNQKVVGTGIEVNGYDFGDGTQYASFVIKNSKINKLNITVSPTVISGSHPVLKLQINGVYYNGTSITDYYPIGSSNGQLVTTFLQVPVAVNDVIKIKASPDTGFDFVSDITKNYLLIESA